MLEAVSPYALLAAIQIPGTAAYVLDKRGHGRVEDLNGVLGLGLILASTPLVFLCGFGMIAAIVWSLVVLSAWKVLAVVLACQAIWGGMCWYFMGWVRVNEHEDLLYALSVPLVFALRLLSASATVLLLVYLWRL